MLRDDAEAVLKTLVGSPDARLRADQWTAIEALVDDHRRALVVERTGWGKSAVYFVATALLRSSGSGPTVIVSPLLALMRNQIQAAERAGIKAVTINSTNPESWRQTYAAVTAGEVDVLLVSPERLNNPEFRDHVLPELARTAGLVVVDEAHCISDWGHDFRPDYRRIRTLLAELPSDIPVLATTATANTRVTNDVAEQLSLTGTATLDNVLVLRGSLDRESLHLGVVSLGAAPERLAWIADYLDSSEGSGIIYCLTVAATEDVADFLRQRGHVVAAYSGKTEQTERLAAENDLLNNRVKALVATSALGMGFDKPDLSFVIHLGAPPSPIAYYQQVGRAGRAVERAEVVLLPAPEDKAIWDYFGSMAFPSDTLVRETLAVLTDTDGPVSTPALEPRVALRRNRLDAMLKVLDVDGAVKRVRGGWEATGEAWTYDAERYERVEAARVHEQQAMIAYQWTTECRLAYLRSALDDPAASRCGRCDNCGGFSPTAGVSDERTRAAQAWLDKPGVPLDPRRQWPTGLASLGLSGRIGAEEQARPGCAVARLTDLGWGNDLRSLFAVDAPDQEVPIALRHALVAVLKGWDWDGEAPPDAIVGIESVTHPLLVRHLADGLSRFTSWPVIARLTITGGAEPNQGAVNSARRLTAVSERYTLVEDQPLRDRRVLLLDDRTITGWTLTVAARTVRRAGAAAVFPLVLAADN